ncbi:MAG TPA: hypothetical protein VF096_01530 [Azonexus sp.]
MNTTHRLLVVATLAVTLIGHAQAGGDHRRHDHDRDYRHHYHQPRHHHHYQPAPRPHRHHHSGWIGPAAVVTLGGIAIGTALSAPPPAVYGGPPAPAGNWYYCGSSGQYYPYTAACPDGWLTVSPR